MGRPLTMSAAHGIRDKLYKSKTIAGEIHSCKNGYIVTTAFLTRRFHGGWIVGRGDNFWKVRNVSSCPSSQILYLSSVL